MKDLTNEFVINDTKVYSFKWFCFQLCYEWKLLEVAFQLLMTFG